MKAGQVDDARYCWQLGRQARGCLLANQAEADQEARAIVPGEQGRDLIDGESRHWYLGDERVVGPQVHLARPQQVLVELLPGPEPGVDDLYRPGGLGD